MGETTQKFCGQILIVGAGQAATKLLQVFREYPDVNIIGVTDINPRAPGLQLAREMGIPTGTDYHPFLEKKPHLILNLTGQAQVQDQLLAEKAPESEVIGGNSALLLWTLISIYQEKEDLHDQYELLQRELQKTAGDEFITGTNPRMQEVANLILKVAPTPTTVLIRGESGTGKEVVARLIHKNSPLSDKPFITINCTTFSPNLIESELFGYVKGAFTGANKNQPGLLELAHGGTVFLDEIGDLPLEMQAKLLRFLQSGEVRPVGSTTTRKVEVRVLAATNRNLEEMIERGEFRADLFYRLNAFTINLPPLRERREDIPLLAYHFLQRAKAKVNKHVSGIETEALNLLMQYHWPGNLRELENVIERAVVLTETDAIRVEDLPLVLRGDTPTRRLSVAPGREGLHALKQRMLDQIEREAIIQYLKQHNGNITRAAQAAGISRRTFHRLLIKHRIEAKSLKQS